MSRICLSIVFLSLCVAISAQTIVQTFNFNSTTRDTVITFPDKDHNSYEKILMHYGMRCKDALVSTSADRNKGCGEWDYSCNTYIVDESKEDVLKRVDPDYVISNFDGEEFSYTTQPTYSYVQSTQRTVEATGTAKDILLSSTTTEAIPFGQEGGGQSMTYILDAISLNNNAANAGPISGLSFPITNGDLMLEDLAIYMAHTTNTAISEGLPAAWTRVYFSDTQVNVDNTKLYFYEDFEWDGFSNVAVQLRYSKATGTSLDMKGFAQDNQVASYTIQHYDDYAEFGGAGHYTLSTGLDELTDEITISFWQNGLAKLPVNSTILEATNAANSREINIHHPWGNGQIYWDCGGNGNGGYDRINKVANPDDYKGQWNHWTFTKNAVSGSMKIYLNGSLWHSGTGNFNPIKASAMNIGAAYFNSNLSAYSRLSEFRIWNKELDQETIAEWMRKPIDASHPAYEDLLVYYAMDEKNGANDLSGQNNNAEVRGLVGHRTWSIDEAVMTENFSDLLPVQILDQGAYTKQITERVLLDSIPNLPNKVDQYVLDGTDRLLDNTSFLYEAGTFPVIDEPGNIVDEKTFIADGSIIPQEMTHFSKSPMAFEIMSFVTPYGIGLDFGEAGESWTFDVTDYGPILKGSKRMYMSRGGQNQEEMDIWFEFIEGEPAREVIDINQVWPVESVGHERITSDGRFEPRIIPNVPNAAHTILKSTITGHGQQGEFVPRQHVMKAFNSDFLFEDKWNVWTECASNPVYPQGGTWVYDRAGWCPGAASDTRLYDLTEIVKGLDTTYLDYTINNVSGASNYIVNAQVVNYGPYKRQIDVAVEDIAYPSPKIEHRRQNPTCQAPTIILKNYGSERITSATINYGVVGNNNVYTYNWSGALAVDKMVSVELDYIDDLLVTDEGDLFFAEVVSANNAADEYAANNTYFSEILPVVNYDSEIVLEFKTNSQPGETTYQVYNEFGTAIHGVTSALTANRVYRDTLRGLEGCYQILIRDSDGDGLSWWANGDGDGYFRMRNIGGSTRVIEPDFGQYAEFNFTAGMVTSDTEDIQMAKGFTVYPNPSSGEVYFADLGQWSDSMEIMVTDQLGHSIISQAVQKYDLIDGLPQLSLLGQGIYYVNLRDKTQSHTQKLVKL